MMEQTIRPDVVITDEDVVEWFRGQSVSGEVQWSPGIQGPVAHLEEIPVMRLNGSNLWVMDQIPVAKGIYAAFDTVTKEGFFVQFKTGP